MALIPLLGQAIYTCPTKTIDKQKEPKTVASTDLNENKSEQKVNNTQAHQTFTVIHPIKRATSTLSSGKESSQHYREKSFTTSCTQNLSSIQNHSQDINGPLTTELRLEAKNPRENTRKRIYRERKENL